MSTKRRQKVTTSKTRWQKHCTPLKSTTFIIDDRRPMARRNAVAIGTRCLLVLLQKSRMNLRMPRPFSHVPSLLRSRPSLEWSLLKRARTLWFFCSFYCFLDLCFLKGSGSLDLLKPIYWIGAAPRPVRFHLARSVRLWSVRHWLFSPISFFSRNNGPKKMPLYTFLSHSGNLSFRNVIINYPPGSRGLPIRLLFIGWLGCAGEA